jgi:hypothetical protein
MKCDQIRFKRKTLGVAALGQSKQITLLLKNEFWDEMYRKSMNLCLGLLRVFGLWPKVGML